MATKRQSSSSKGGARGSSPRPARPAPVGISRAAIAPHPRTLANGKPRPTRRGK